MATLIKDKNYLVFTNVYNRTYKLDIATGIFYSTRGLPLKNWPDGFISYISRERGSILTYYIFNESYFNRVSCANLPKLADKLITCDRLDSLGYSNREGRWFDVQRENLDFVKNHFKQFAKFFNENNARTISDFYESYGKIAMLENLKIKVDDYYTEEIIDTLWRIHRKFTDNELKLIAYYLSRGLYIFFENYDYGYLFRNFFDWCADIEYQPTKDDFFKQYIMVKKNYMANKAQFDNRKIVNHLAKHSHIWEFENDDFCIVVPQTTEDFKREGDNQQNCVYTRYLQRVVEGDTNVVFVRRKSEPEKSFITCEVDNGGSILQYLYARNRRIDTDTAEYEFLKQFTRYIRNNW